jgi:hypothetical protein
VGEGNPEGFQHGDGGEGGGGHRVGLKAGGERERGIRKGFQHGVGGEGGGAIEWGSRRGLEERNRGEARRRMGGNNKQPILLRSIPIPQKKVVWRVITKSLMSSLFLLFVILLY